MTPRTHPGPGDLWSRDADEFWGGDVDATELERRREDAAIERYEEELYGYQ